MPRTGRAPREASALDAGVRSHGGARRLVRARARVARRSPRRARARRKRRAGRRRVSSARAHVHRRMNPADNGSSPRPVCAALQKQKRRLRARRGDAPPPQPPPRRRRRRQPPRRRRRRFPEAATAVEQRSATASAAARVASSTAGSAMSPSRHRIPPGAARRVAAARRRRLELILRARGARAAARAFSLVETRPRASPFRVFLEKIRRRGPESHSSRACFESPSRNPSREARGRPPPAAAPAPDHRPAARAGRAYCTEREHALVRARARLARPSATPPARGDRERRPRLGAARLEYSSSIADTARAAALSSERIPRAALLRPDGPNSAFALDGGEGGGGDDAAGARRRTDASSARDAAAPGAASPPLSLSAPPPRRREYCAFSPPRRPARSARAASRDSRSARARARVPAAVRVAPRASARPRRDDALSVLFGASTAGAPGALGERLRESRRGPRRVAGLPQVEDRRRPSAERTSIRAASPLGRHRVATSATNSAQAPARCAAARSSAARVERAAWRTALRTARARARRRDSRRRRPFPARAAAAPVKSRAPSAGTLAAASSRDVSSKHPPAAAGRRSRSASAPAPRAPRARARRTRLGRLAASAARNDVQLHRRRP